MIGERRAVSQTLSLFYGMLRRERNRASALEAYYRIKARRAELEGQLLSLKEEDAALHALAAMAEADTATGGETHASKVPGS